MANVLDYINWRGDLTFEQDKFNDVDALILSRLSYIPFDNIVSSDLNTSITLLDATDKLLKDGINPSIFLWKTDPEFIKLLSKSKRFANMKLSGFVNIVEPENQMQFSAVVIEVAKNFYYISFRGTDITIVGWQEDFNMYYMFPLPSQNTAVKYLENVANTYKGEFILGGHSKGGNLAVYSAVYCQPKIRKRIVYIYNHDGPGFNSKTIETDEFKKISKILNTYVPQSSIFGMMLEHSEDYTIVKSTQKGFLQHDIYSWEINRTELIPLNKMTNTSLFFDHTLKEFAYSLSNEQKKDFVEGVFSLLENTEDKTFIEILYHWRKNSKEILRSFKNMDNKTRRLILSTLLRFIKCAKNNFSDINPLSKETRLNWAKKSKTEKKVQKHEKKINKIFEKNLTLKQKRHQLYANGVFYRFIID